MEIMIQRYWNKMTQMKFHLIYLGYHYHRTTIIERTINIVLAVVSTGSLAGLFASSYQRIMAIILVSTQILTAAKPYLPFCSRMNELDKGITAWNVIYNEVEKQWNEVYAGKYSDDRIIEMIYDFEKQWEAVDAEVLRGDSLPRNEKFIEMADKEKNRYFETMFGGGNE